jgi:hypothetical protein
MDKTQASMKRPDVQFVNDCQGRVTGGEVLELCDYILELEDHNQKLELVARAALEFSAWLQRNLID